MRIPVEYLAGFLAAGDPEPVRRSLGRLAAMRRFMRAANVDGRVDAAIARDVGMEPAEIEEMFRMVAIGDYDDRYVIPQAPRRGLARRPSPSRARAGSTSPA